MSSSMNIKSTAIVAVQSGIVAWEDPIPIADSRYKTVTLIDSRRTFVAKILWDFIASRPSSLVRTFRVSVTRIPPAATAGQKRRLAAQIAVDPPGFSSTRTEVVGNVCYAVSELLNINVVDVNFLTDYRHCLLAVTNSEVPFKLDSINIIASEASEFGGIGIAKILESEEPKGIILIVSTQHYSAVQFLGRPEFCEVVSAFLGGLGVRRIHGIHKVNEEIRRLRT